MASATSQTAFAESQKALAASQTAFAIVANSIYDDANVLCSVANGVCDANVTNGACVAAEAVCGVANAVCDIDRYPSHVDIPLCKVKVAGGLGVPCSTSWDVQQEISPSHTGELLTVGCFA